MWNRIYLLLLAICTAIMAALTYYSWSWLRSIGAPPAAVEGYLYHSGIGLTFLLISSIVLLIAANVVLAKPRQSWAMWATFIYFAVFVVIRSFGLERSFFHFKEANGMTESSFTLAPVAGALICLAAAAIVYINQFAVVRMTERMYPTAEPELQEVDKIVNSEAAKETEE